MRKLRVHTQSGAVYLLDEKSMTWERAHDAGVKILGYPKKRGKLFKWPVVEVGKRMHLDIIDPELRTDESWILSTAIVRIELLSDLDELPSNQPELETAK